MHLSKFQCSALRQPTRVLVAPIAAVSIVAVAMVIVGDAVAVPAGEPPDLGVGEQVKPFAVFSAGGGRLV